MTTHAQLVAAAQEVRDECGEEGVVTQYDLAMLRAGIALAMTPAPADAQPVAPRTVLDLAMMVRLLCRKVSVLKGPNDALVERAFVLLRTHDLQGSPLRDDLPPAAPAQDVGECNCPAQFCQPGTKHRDYCPQHAPAAPAKWEQAAKDWFAAYVEARDELTRLRAALSAALLKRDKYFDDAKAWEQQAETANARADANAKDAERYRWLRDMRCSSMHVTLDDEHAPNYMTATQWIEEHPEDFEHDPPDEVKRMRDSGHIWCVQIYPHTPVGFNFWHAATLDAAIDAAKGTTP